MFKHILIPTDGSPVANRAARAGIALARRLGAKVTAYRAIEELQPLYVEGYAFNQKELDRFTARAREAAQRHVDAIGKLAKAAGVPFTAVVGRAFTPYEGIITAAKKRKCDVIFMASRGHRGLARLIIGSVTQKVLAHSAIPVVGTTERRLAKMQEPQKRDARQFSFNPLQGTSPCKPNFSK